jgi:quinol monooxygenase YgiN
MVTIERGRPLVTLVNVFTVEPPQQRALVDLLVTATKETMSRLPGFVSASIHRSLDGTRVVNYAQWRSLADFEAIRQNAEAREHMAAAGRLAAFEPILCEVSDSLGVHS